ncbi:MAG: hypothetical protein EPO11_05845 [Gammaproteobacteria bacterium]|nr:MAG: hypothetical protein EPO11_05845 [Gammaproteobacteria bacterium]
MQERLIIYLDTDHPSWAVVNADGVVAQHACRDDAIGFAQLAENREVWLIVPVEDVLLTSVQLPHLSRSKRLQAIPFALEDELIDEVETLHFAMGDTLADGNVSVAVVSREKMQAWVALLQSWQIEADQFIPASLALPYEENSWYVLMEKVAIVRTSLWQGFACDQANLPQILDWMTPPKVIYLSSENFIYDLAQQVTRTPFINLLQGVYTKKKSTLPHIHKLWKITAYTAAVWVGLLFLYPIVSYFILKSQESAIEYQIAQIYKRNFPQASSVVAPKLRMQEKLQQQEGQAGENRLLTLLGQVGKGLSTAHNVKLKRLDFQNNQLTLELTAATPDNFSLFTDYLTQQGLSVKQQSANLAGTQINAVIEIE